MTRRTYFHWACGGRHFYGSETGRLCSSRRGYVASGAAIGVLCTATVVASTTGLGLNSLRSQPKSRTSTVVVTSIVDGDTIRVADLGGKKLGRVQLLGIDAPEAPHDGQPGECYHAEATRALTQLTPVGASVQLVTDPSQPSKDQWGRLLRYVDHKGDDVSRELVDQGAAQDRPSTPPLTRADAYASAETDARSTDRGQWGSCR